MYCVIDDSNIVPPYIAINCFKCVFFRNKITLLNFFWNLNSVLLMLYYTSMTKKKKIFFRITCTLITYKLYVL